jgi:hypothetical protein
MTAVSTLIYGSGNWFKKNKNVNVIHSSEIKFVTSVKEYIELDKIK